jgi:hypothetical protein
VPRRGSIAGGWREVAGANALVQRARFDLGFDAQLVGQHLLAALVLGQRGVAIPRQRQPAHQLAVGWLVPGFQLQLAARRAHKPRIVAHLLVVIGQRCQGVQRLLVQCFAPHQGPLLECGCVDQIKAGEKFAAVELDRLLQAHGALHAWFAPLVAVRAAGASSSWKTATSSAPLPRASCTT